MGPWSRPPGPAGGPSPSCGRWTPKPSHSRWKCRCWRPSTLGTGPCCGCHGCCWSPQSPCPRSCRSRSPHRPWSATSPPGRPRCGCSAASPCSACSTAPRSRPWPPTKRPTAPSRRWASPASGSVPALPTPPWSRPASLSPAPAWPRAADISASYGRALLADFQADPTLTHANGQPTAGPPGDGGP
jgi:hypothetical protein